MKHFIDNSIAPIIAIDFDGTINVGDGYPDPHNGTIRKYAKEIINFLYDCGVKVVIWTNRKNIPHTDIKDKLLMKQWLNDVGIKYHTVNDSTHFAPFKYYGRKLYAHMFVDDRGFGFNCDNSEVMLDVLNEFLCDIIGIDEHMSCNIITTIIDGEPLKYYINYIKDILSTWNKGDSHE